VEVYLYGEWGTVNDYEWGLNDAQVVCNELGYGNATATINNAFYGRGSTRVYLRRVNCIGTEWSIGNCSDGEWSSVSFSYYSHSNDASARCSTGNV